MTVLLTGATGFLGSHLARALVERGDRVLAYRRRTSRLDHLAGLAERADWFELDRDPLELPFQRASIDAVIHAATKYGRQGESVADLVQSNVHFPLGVYAAASAAGTSTFFNVHTALAREVSAYAMSKHQLLEWLSMASGPTKAIHLALEHFYGPGDDPSKFVESLLRKMTQGVASIPLTKGEQRRDFLFVDDAVTACLTCLDHASDFAPGEVVPIGSGQPVTIREVAEACQALTGSCTKLDFGAVPYRTHEVMHSTADLRRLNALGWQPRFCLSEGLAVAARSKS